MAGFLIWGVFSVAVAALCFWRPQTARIFVGVFFAVMGLGVHGAMVATDPQGYVDFADAAPWAPYRELSLWLVEPHPLVFGVFMLVFETVLAVLVLSHGRYVTWGLVGAIVFLVGITPLGLEEVPNVVLAGGLAYLSTRHFPSDAWTVLRRHSHGHRRPREAEVSVPR